MKTRTLILIFFLFAAGCTVQLYPPVKKVEPLPPVQVEPVSVTPDGGVVMVNGDTIPQEYSARKRFYWEQIEQSDSTQSFAVTNGSKDGRWLRGDSMRWIPAGPFVTVMTDTVATRAYSRSVLDGNGIISALPDGSVTIQAAGQNNPLSIEWPITAGGTNSYFYYDGKNYNFYGGSIAENVDVEFIVPGTGAEFRAEMETNRLYMNGSNFWTELAGDTTFYLDLDEVAFPQIEYMSADSVVVVNSQNRIGKMSVANIAGTPQTIDTLSYDNTTGILSASLSGDGVSVNTVDINTLYPESYIYNVNINGVNSTAKIGDYKYQFADPWSAIDTAYVKSATNPIQIEIAPGTYTFSGTYLADNSTSLLQPSISNKVLINAPNAIISYQSSPYTTGFITDMNAGWSTSSNPVVLDLNVKKLSMLSPVASIACPILITNPGSKLSGYIGTVESTTTFGTTSRYWGLELGANYVDLKIDTIWYDGDLAVSYWRSYDGTGSVNSLYQRNMKIDLNYVYVASQRGGIGGAFRVQTGATFPTSGQTDSLSTYMYKINQVDVSPTTTHDYLVDFGSQASVDVVYGNTYVADIETINGAAFEEAIFGMTVGSSDTMRASKITYKADRIVGVDKGIFGISSVGGVFDDIDLNIDLGQVDFEVDGYITLALAGIYNSRINIHCDDCSTTYGDAVIKLNPTASAGNKITISGNWQNNTAQPVIDVSGLNSTDTLILKNLQIRNDGSVASINSTSAKTVYVQSAFDYNNIIKDSDITFTRLDEYAVGAPQYAQSYNEGGANSSVTAGTPEQIVSTTVGTTDTIATTSEFVVQADADIQYNGNNNAIVKITADVSFSTSSSAYVLFYIAINGTVQSSSELRVNSLGTIPATANITFVDIDADNGDVYSIYTEPTVGSRSYTVNNLRLLCEKVN